MNLGVKEFSNLIYGKLEELAEALISTHPDNETTFPCREIDAPIKSVKKSQPVDTFQISIKHWHENLNQAMEMSDKTDEKLSDYNLIRIKTEPYIYDENIEKYGITTTYEVNFNRLTNAFQIIK